MPKPFLVEVVAPKIAAKSRASSHKDGEGKGANKTARKLAPSLARTPIYVPKPGALLSPSGTQGPAPGRDQSESIGIARDLLLTESKVADVFDGLARRVHLNLVYPEMLFENGIVGNATLDIYFDSKGRVREDRAALAGSNRYLRGLLGRAARKGLVDWLNQDFRRLRLDQLRGQHFRAEFVIAYSQTDRSELLKAGLGSYNLLRRKVSNVACLGSVDGAVAFDAACLLVTVGNAIHRKASDNYRGRFEQLKETLEHFDELGLSGINDLAAEAS